jgi:hypothetical protein
MDRYFDQHTLQELPPHELDRIGGGCATWDYQPHSASLLPEFIGFRDDVPSD